jgi:autotransporter-associated beta strand protein
MITPNRFHALWTLCRPVKMLRVAMGVLLTLGLAENFGTTATAVAADSKKPMFEDEIRAGFAAGQAEVPVIVTLVPPARAPQPTDWDRPASLATLRAANHERATVVLNALAAKPHKLRHRFDNFAGFSATVSPEALDELARHPLVAAIEPVRQLEMHLNQGIPLMNALATRGTYTGTNLAIAICDTGIDYTHPRLGGGGFPNSKVIGGYDYGNNDTNPMPVGQAHGTACAGIAAGDLGTVGDYIGGVAPGAKLYALKISPDNSGSASSDAMIAAWDWCVTHKNDDPNNPILVISTSFGGGRYYSACDSASAGMTAAANAANAAGITVLASSGNDGYCDSMGWPACISSVISVGAAYDANFGNYTPCVNSGSCANKIATSGCSTGYYVNDSTAPDKVTAYSNSANFLDIFAPANQCYTTDMTGSPGYSTGDYTSGFGGTSAACPYAAGAVAALQSAAKALTGSYLTPSQVRSNLAATGNQLTDSKVAITKARVNLGNAIAAISGALLSSDSLTLTGESCLPTNNAADPGELVTVALAIRNTGGSATSNLVATLLATNGVTSPSAPQSYGAIPGNGGVVTQTFSFVVAGTCGGTILPTLQLQDGAKNYGNISYSLVLGALVVVWTENFDGVTAPTLPAGWTTAAGGGQSAWVTTTAQRDTLPNSAFSTDAATVGSNELVSTAISVTSSNAQLSFRNYYNTEAGWDGGVLEIKIGAGAFTDIITAGGSFVSGGYNGTLGSGNPLAGRDAWTGNSSGFITTAVNLPASAAGQTVQFRWRCATDSSVAGSGWWVDTISFSERVCCAGGFVNLTGAGTTLTAESCAPGNSQIDPEETVTVQFAIQNTGTGNTSNLVATLLATGGVTTPSGPQTYGVVTGGAAAVSRPFTFTATGSCGGTLTAVLQLQDGATNYGNLTNIFNLGQITGSSMTQSNTTSITIPNSGAAAVYPSTNVISGVTNTITGLTVTLNNLTHNRSQDLDILLVGPGGQTCLLMSDAGNGSISDVTLTFADGAPALPSSAITNGTYAPTDYTSGDTFDAPAPAGPYGTNLTVFTGIDPNGPWLLYIMDDQNPQNGTLAGGWHLTFSSLTTNCCSSGPPGSNANLADLVPSAGTLTPPFNLAITNYTASVAYPTTSLTVTPTAADTNATIRVNGNPVASGNPSAPIALSTGINIIATEVVSANLTVTNIYTLTVTRDPGSFNAHLANLVPSAGTLTPTFTSNTFSYTASVPYATTSLTVTPTAATNNAAITVNGSPVASGNPSDPISLNVGANLITTRVVSENLTTTNEYTLTVTRIAGGTNAQLTNLVPSAGTLTPTFDSSTFSYTADVPFGTATLTVTPTAADPLATIQVNGNPVASGNPSAPINLNVGPNLIDTQVVSEDQATTNTYSLTVTRAASVNRWWDGGSVDIPDPGNGLSGGGSGVWDTTIQNWDQGSGQVHVAWNNANGNIAVFGGAAGTVTNQGVTVGGMVFTAAYTVLSNTVTFAAAGSISNSAAVTIASAIAGPGPLAKEGTGALTLSASNTFSGEMIIQAGQVTASSANAFGVTTNIVFTGSGSLTTAHSAYPNFPQGLQINAGVTAHLNPINQFYHMTFGGVVSGPGTLLIAGTDNGNGNITLTNTGNTHTGTIRISQTTLAGNLFTASLSDGAGAIELGGTTGAGNLTFQNTVAAHVFAERQVKLTGTTGGGSLINNGAHPLTFQRDLAVTGTGNKTLTLSGSNTGTNLFAGAIANGVSNTVISVTKTGAGMWALTGTNTYSGLTIITGGILQVGNGGTSGTLGSGNVTNNARLVFHRADTLAVSNAIFGTGQLSQTGAGTLELAGSNTYTGITTVATSTLLYNGSLAAGAGAIIVSNGATLGGTGTVSRALTILSGGTLTPGMPYGPLTVTSNATVASGARLAIQLDATQVGQLTVSDTLTIAGATLQIITNGPATQPAYVLATYGTLTGTFAVTNGIPAGYVLDYAYNAGTAIALVQLDAPPVITGQPQPQAVCVGGTAGFNVTATGNNLNFQWQRNAGNLAEGGHYTGVTTSNLTVSSADAGDAGDYRCIVSNTGGSVTSSVAALTVSFPVLSVTPASLNFGNVLVGTTASNSFVVGNTGCGTLTVTVTTGGAFGASPGAFAIGAGHSTNVTVTFSPVASVGYATNVVFSSNGGSSANPVSGAGVSLPVASFTATPTNGVAPLNVSFTDTSTGAPTSWHWDFGDASTSTMQNPAHTFAAGTWLVSLIASNEYGASAPATQTISVITVQQSWEQAYGVLADETDSDGDGMSNRQEMLAGFNPTNATSFARIVSVVPDGAGLWINYLGANGDTSYTGGPSSRTNVLESAASLTNNFTTTGQTNILSGGTGTGLVTNFFVPNALTLDPARYYRVRVVTP